jgi:hypothetical protein
VHIIQTGGLEIYLLGPGVVKMDMMVNVDVVVMMVAPIVVMEMMLVVMDHMIVHTMMVNKYIVR